MFTMIHYVVVHPTDTADDWSLFQGYGKGLSETAFAFERIARLPWNVTEFNRDPRKRLASRMQGDGSTVTPMQIDVVPNFLQIEFPFVCVCSHPDTSAECDAYIAEANRPIHHVRLPRVETGSGMVVLQEGGILRFVEAPAVMELAHGPDALRDLSEKALLDHCLQVIQFLEKKGGDFAETAEKVRRQMGSVA